jgi:hypothetical protein
MRPDKKQRIIKVHRRAQNVLNVWKQRIINRCSSLLLLSLFPDSLETKYFLATEDQVDPGLIVKMSFTKLRVTKRQIIAKLVDEGILPPDFHKLEEPACM